MKRFIKYLIIIIGCALFSTAAHAQKVTRNDVLIVKDSLKIPTGAAANKIAKCNENGTLQWVFFSEYLDSSGTIFQDTIISNLVLINQKLYVTRDSFTDPAATIASISDSGQIVECFTCDTIQMLLDSLYGSPWTYNGTGQIVERDTTLNVGIGTSNPTDKLHVLGSVTLDSSNVKLEFGKNKGLLLMDGLSYSQSTNIANGIRFNLGYSNDVSAYLIELNLTNGSDFTSINLQDNGILNLNGSTNVNIGDHLTYTDGTQADGYVLTSDAGGNATWQDPNAYGEMGFGDSSRLVALTQNVYSVVTNSNKTLWSSHATVLHNVTYAGDSLIVDSSGVFKVDLILSLFGTANTVIKLGVFVNGALVLPTQQLELQNVLIAQMDYMQLVALNAGDILKVVATNTTDNDDITVVSGTILINRID